MATAPLSAHAPLVTGKPADALTELISEFERLIQSAIDAEAADNPRDPQPKRVTLYGVEQYDATPNNVYCHAPRQIGEMHGRLVWSASLEDYDDEFGRQASATYRLCWHR